MKKIIKKISLFFLVIFNILFTKVYANMTAEAMEESAKFYDEHKFLIDSTKIVSRLMHLTLMFFIIIIPIIIIYKKIKQKNNPNEKDSYIIKTLGLAELLCIINTFITGYASMLYGHGSESALRINIFIIIISLLNIGIILFNLLKKNKVSWFLDTNLDTNY